MVRNVPGLVVEAAVKRFSLRLGGVEFAVERMSKTISSGADPRTVQPGRRSRPTIAYLTAAGTVGVALASLAAMGFGVLGSGATASAGRYVLSVPVPAAGPSHARPRKAATRPAPRAPVAQPKTTPAADDAQAPELGTAEREDDRSPDLAARFDTPERAVAAAAATGRLQEWARPDGSERGFVVAGTPEQGAAGCRNLSILTRRGEDDQVTNVRRCGADGVSGAHTG